MNDPESQDIDSDSQDNYQGDVNDQEHIEFDPPVHYNTYFIKWNG